MASLYEIEKSINDLMEIGYKEFINEETGEFNEEAFNKALGELEVEKSQKIENIGLFIKNLNADISELKAEEKAFTERRKAKEQKVENLKKFLPFILDNKFETSKIALSFMKSNKVKILDEEKIPKEFLKEKVTVLPDKTAIKKAINAGQAVDGAELVEEKNLQIK